MSATHLPTVRSAMPQTVPSAASLNANQKARIIWRGPQALQIASVRRHRLVAMSALFLAAAGFATAALLFQIDEISSTLVWLAAVLSLELLLVPPLVWHGRFADFGGALILSSLCGFVAVAAYISGGLNQPLLSLVVAMPVLATLLMSPRAGLAVTFSLCAVLAWFIALRVNGYGADLPMLALLGDEAVLRGGVLMLGTVLAAATIWAYESKTNRMVDLYRAQQQNDVVTGLSNRWQFETARRQQISRGRVPGHCVALLLIDIDDFRRINAQYGRAHGDELLMRVGAAIQAAANDPYSLVTRLESDCFALSCWCSSRSGIRTIYDRVQLLVSGAVADMPCSANQKVSVTIGVGTLSAEECARTQEPAAQVYTLAALALVEARSVGPNKVKLHAVAA